MFNCYLEDGIIRVTLPQQDETEQVRGERLRKDLLELLPKAEIKIIEFGFGGEPLNPALFTPVFQAIPYIKDLKADAEIVLVSGIEPVEESIGHYLDMCRVKSWTPIDIIFRNTWEAAMAKNLNTDDQSELYISKTRSKLFFCQNNGSRIHRLYLIAELIARKLEDQGYLSMLFQGQDADRIFNAVLNISHLKRYAPRFAEKIKSTLEQNRQRFPMILDVMPGAECPNLWISSDRSYYLDSYFSVINETQFYCHKDVFTEYFLGYIFSEKSFKPIAMRQPFILTGVQGCLALLRKKGYQTFHPYINETYDTIEDPELRLIAIADEIERLSKFTESQWLEWQQNVAERVEHNYQRLKNAKLISLEKKF